MSLFRSLLGRKTTAKDVLDSGVPVGEFDPSRAGALRRDGRFGEALRYIRSRMATLPDDVGLQLECAALLIEWGRRHEATALLVSVMDRPSLSGEQREALGPLLMAVNRNADAVRVLTAVASERTRGARRGLCLALRASGQYAEAIAVCADVLAEEPDDVEVRLTQCLSYIALNDPDAAALAACEILRVDPDNAIALFCLGDVHRLRKRFPEAIELIGRAIANGSDRLANGGYVDLASLYVSNGMSEKALTVLEEGLAATPTPEMRRTYGQVLLSLGRFDEGWAQYEFRWFMSPLLEARMRGALPPWEGTPLDGKVILLRIEQGFGDTIQFMRYAPSLKALGAKVVMRQLELSHRFLGVDGILGQDFSTGDIDCYVNLMSLPLIFATELATIPAPIPYISLSQSHSDRWRDFFQDRPRPRVGLVWAGNPQHPSDGERSLSLSYLIPLLENSRIHFYALQKEATHERDLALLDESDIVNLGPLLGSYDDTAAVIANLDLVITVDTSVAHLAGALGRSVWLLLASPAEWRWMKGRNDTPWYPTMRLFRQPVPGDWQAVIKEVAAALETWLPAPAGEGSNNLIPVVIPREGRGIPDGSCLNAAVLNRRDVLLQYFPTRDAVGRSLAATGGHFQGVIDFLGSLPLGGATVIEALPGIGHHTVPIARLVDENLGQVIAFEPDAHIRRILLQNLDANRVGNVAVISRELWGAFDASRLGHGDTVDDLALTRLDVVKLGVAHNTLEALQGAEESIWKFRPRVVLEVSHASALHAACKWLRDRAYRSWQAPNGMLSGEPLCMVALPEEGSEGNQIPRAFVEITAGVVNRVTEQ